MVRVGRHGNKAKEYPSGGLKFYAFPVSPTSAQVNPWSSSWICVLLLAPVRVEGDAVQSRLHHCGGGEVEGRIGLNS